MNIKKECLAQLDMAYAINIFRIGNKTYCICASESRNGKIVLIDCQTRAVHTINGLAGGIMSIIPIPEEKASFIAIQKFYPVFQSEKAEIVKIHFIIGDTDEINAQVVPIAQLPYVHRIMLAGSPGRRKIIAGTLCQEKAYEQDWSTAGAVYLIDLSDNPHGNTRVICLLDGIHKHHGMFVDPESNVFISGEEGVFSIDVRDDTFITKKELSDSVSDLCLFDIDDDGEKEMIAIKPFHGDSLSFLRKTRNQWQCIAQDNISFGHALWCGKIEGKPYAIVCSRGSDKVISLYELKTDSEGGIAYVKSTIDSGVGASNIVVDQERGKTVLYTANHGANEVARYSISGIVN